MIRNSVFHYRMESISKLENKHDECTIPFMIHPTRSSPGVTRFNRFIEREVFISWEFPALGTFRWVARRGVEWESAR